MHGQTPILLERSTYRAHSLHPDVDSTRSPLRTFLTVARRIPESWAMESV